MGVASGCGEQEAGVASGSGWNLCVWLLGVVVRRYIDFLILLIPTPLVSVLFTAASLLFVHKKINIFHSSDIVYPESFRSNAQNANAVARRNCPRVDRNDEFACVY